MNKPVPFVAALGERGILFCRWLIYITSVSFAVTRHCFRPITWRRSVRKEFVRQCYFSGAQALKFLCFLGILVGMGMVYQIFFWLNLAGESEYTGEFLVRVLIRELAPVLVALIVIGRSGSAIVSELGSMRISGQVRVLDAMGIDPFLYMVLPRVAAISLCIFCLTVTFLVVALGSGFMFAHLIGIGELSFNEFMHDLLMAMRPSDYAAVALKTFVPGLVIGVICCVNGLGVTSSVTEIPRRLTVTFSQCVLTLFVVSAVITLLI